jgi:Predicted phosphoadenosine phosphosulfate sulfotransferase
MAKLLYKMEFNHLVRKICRFYSNLQKASSQIMLILIQGEEKLNRMHRPKYIEEEILVPTM